MGQSELEAPLMRVDLEKDDGPPRRIELDGGVTAQSTAPNSDGAGRGADGEDRRPSMTAPVVGSSMPRRRGPWIDVRFIGGEGYFERELKAWVLRGVVGEEGLINLRAEDGVCIREVPIEGPVRRGEASEARVWFSEGQATDVEMLRNVVIQGEGVEGRGYRARLSPQAGLLMLHGDPAGPERVLLLSERGRLSCDQAQLFNNEGRSEARGNVQGQILDVSLIGRSAADASQPTHFASEILDVTDEGGIYHLRENTRLWQGHRLLLADDVVFHQDAGDGAGDRTRADDVSGITVEPRGRRGRRRRGGREVARFRRQPRAPRFTAATSATRTPDHTLAAAELSVFFDDEQPGHRG